MIRIGARKVLEIRRASSLTCRKIVLFLLHTKWILIAFCLVLRTSNHDLCPPFSFCIKYSLFPSFWNIVQFENFFELTSTQYMYQIVTPQNRSFMLHIKHLRRKNVQILDSNFCSRLLSLEFIWHLLHKRTVSFSFSFWKNVAEYVFCLLFYVHLSELSSYWIWAVWITSKWNKTMNEKAHHFVMNKETSNNDQIDGAAVKSSS